MLHAQLYQSQIGYPRSPRSSSFMINDLLQRESSPCPLLPRQPSPCSVAEQHGLSSSRYYGIPPLLSPRPSLIREESIYQGEYTSFITTFLWLMFIYSFIASMQGSQFPSLWLIYFCSSEMVYFDSVGLYCSSLLFSLKLYVQLRSFWSCSDSDTILFEIIHLGSLKIETSA